MDEQVFGEIVALTCPYCGHKVASGLIPMSDERSVYWETVEAMWWQMQQHLRERHLPPGHDRYPEIPRKNANG